MIIDIHVGLLVALAWAGVGSGIGLRIAGGASDLRQTALVAVLWPFALLLLIPGAWWPIIRLLPVGLAIDAAHRTQVTTVRLIDEPTRPARVAYARECTLNTVNGVWFVPIDHGERLSVPLLWRFLPLGVLLARLHRGGERIHIAQEDGSPGQQVRALRIGGTLVAKFSDRYAR